MKFSLLIPCYNEENAIEQTVDNIVSSIPAEYSYEIIVIDDGSTDKSHALLSALEKCHDNLRVLQHLRNKGYGASLKSGLNAAQHDYIVITDADGTYPNERISEFVSLCVDQDMVVGARTGPDVAYSKIRA
ncbi:MAG: glycosyl transferase family 2, partial [Kordiimonadales bacterium]